MMMNQNFVRAAAAAVTALAVGVASGQLRPARVAYGVDRPMPMSIAVPEGAGDDVKVQLLEAGTAEVFVESSASPGAIDFAELFPQLWADQPARVLYAQLVVDGERFGPAVTLIPMVTPDVASPAGRGVVFQSEQMMAAGRQRPVTYSGVRAVIDRDVLIETSKGEVRIRLRPDAAPNTAMNFRRLVEEGYYTDIIFHRIVKNAGNGHPFVVQVGDPTGQGSGGPGYFVDLEPSNLPHDFGVVSMARSGDPNSNGSQFFICLSRAGTSFLDGNYTTFGEAIDGAGTIMALEGVETGPGDRPVDPPVLISARLVDAAPYGTGPAPVERPEAAPVDR